MSTKVSLSRLVKMNHEIRMFKKENPEFSKSLELLIGKNRRFGLKNFIKLFIGAKTPRELKKGKNSRVS